MSIKSDQTIDYKNAVKAAGIGAWEMDNRTGRIKWDEQCLLLLELKRPEFHADANTNGLQESDILEIEIQLVQAMYKNGPGVFDHTVRLDTLQKNVLRWIQLTGQAQFDEDGNLTSFTGVARKLYKDITRKLRLNQIDFLPFDPKRKPK